MPVSLKLYRQEYISHRASQEYDVVSSGIDFSTEEKVRNMSSVSSRVIEEGQLLLLNIECKMHKESWEQKLDLSV